MALAVPALAPSSESEFSGLPQAVREVSQDTGCAPTTADRQLSAEAKSVVRTGPRTIRYELAVQHIDGYISLYTPPYVHEATSRTYRALAETYIVHNISNPCNGPDGYGFAFDLTCRRFNGSSYVTNECNYLVYATLYRKTISGLWQAPWGWREYHQTHQTDPCNGLGTLHDLADDSYWVRTQIMFQVRFWIAFTSPQQDFLTTPRSTSSLMLWSGNLHNTSYASDTGSFGGVSDWPTPLTHDEPC